MTYIKSGAEVPPFYADGVPRRMDMGTGNNG
jgi:hypothetical protein